MGRGLPQILTLLVHGTRVQILRERKGFGFKGPQITASSGNLKMFATLSKHSFFFFWPNCPLGIQDLFPDQGSNPGHGSNGD